MLSEVLCLTQTQFLVLLGLTGISIWVHPEHLHHQGCVPPATLVNGEVLVCSQASPCF